MGVKSDFKIVSCDMVLESSIVGENPRKSGVSCAEVARKPDMLSHVLAHDASKEEIALPRQLLPVHETTAFKFQLRKKASRKLALWFRDKTPSRKSGVSKIYNIVESLRVSWRCGGVSDVQVAA